MRVHSCVSIALFYINVNVNADVSMPACMYLCMYVYMCVYLHCISGVSDFRDRCPSSDHNRYFLRKVFIAVSCKPRQGLLEMRTLTKH